MKFCDMPYKRVTYEEVKARYEKLTHDLQNAADAQAAKEVIRQRHQLLADMTPMELCYVRHDMNVNDAFYAAEQEYYDEIGPKLTDLSNQFDRLLLDSPWRYELEAFLGKQAFTILEENLLGFDSRLIPLMQEENVLLARYNQLTSNAAVLWNKELVKRTLMSSHAQSADREIRKKAALAISASWEEQRGELEEIYDQLVHNRHRQAQALGFPDYVALSYHLMRRIGYFPKDVSAFRDQVKKELSPFWAKLEMRRRDRLGLTHLYSWDNGIFFPEGNPRPIGDTNACLEATRKMYTGLSPETAEYISFLLDNGLYDAEIRDGKRSGGYMTFFEKYRSPFIFANFDGTSENAYIMCHEGGHAFQGYLKRNEEIREQCWLTSEAAETHAMAMEFFTYPYMPLFFGERAKDYYTMHQEDAVRLIISECLQDEFQQLVYERPDMSAGERNALWAQLEKAYFPGKDYSGNENLQKGCGWQRIPHMFHWPFYAIDYALAQVCALEYYEWMNRDPNGAWQSYLSFCRATGTASFPQLVKDAGLNDPFDSKTLHKLVEWLQTALI